MEKMSPIIRARGEGDRRWFLGGGVHTWKLTCADTQGAFFMFEDLLEQGKVTPLHVHPEASETLYVLEGTIVAHVNGEEREVSEGGVVMFPRGVAHAFRVASASARVLCIHAPGTGEAFYKAASEPSTANTGPVDFKRLAELASEHSALDILGPPPFTK